MFSTNTSLSKFRTSILTLLFAATSELKIGISSEDQSDKESRRPWLRNISNEGKKLRRWPPIHRQCKMDGRSEDQWPIGIWHSLPHEPPSTLSYQEQCPKNTKGKKSLLSVAIQSHDCKEKKMKLFVFTGLTPETVSSATWDENSKQD
ncbi:hypothetical protein C0J52_27553 [Blattella germanica]|nr:hypothetical protein C0J52_27553 [Blattella germanica]